MNPHQQNKVDISVRSPEQSRKIGHPCSRVKQSMSADEQRLFRMYGKLPNKKDLLQNKLKVGIQVLVPLTPGQQASLLGTNQSSTYLRND